MREIYQQAVSQIIDAMVAAEPDLAWLKEMEARGDVDWRPPPIGAELKSWGQQ